LVYILPNVYLQFVFKLFYSFSFAFFNLDFSRCLSSFCFCMFCFFYYFWCCFIWTGVCLCEWQGMGIRNAFFLSFLYRLLCMLSVIVYSLGMLYWYANIALTKTYTVFKGILLRKTFLFRIKKTTTYFEYFCIVLYGILACQL
jgi:hypothetical protein